ncbi:hypothetical protein EGW08_022003 [Elysia chlorotica]|uniref:DUF7869 domain-containing protein n=1 Tax=Elysia chlorotica TaxID=188477 RepID=A0A433SM54_ELYCH|nr:hypothetical protein EGW08_022003 [Elysia chlorotica]
MEHMETQLTKDPTNQELQKKILDIRKEIEIRMVGEIRGAQIRSGFPPKDRRGKHFNRPHRVSDERHERIRSQISSFRGRLSHYSRHKSRKLYLPAELNIMKMFALYEQQYGDGVSYDTYRQIFNGDFNISFGYPRTDTCAICDEFFAGLTNINKELDASPEDANLLRQKAEIVAHRELHQRKSETFYERKRNAKVKAKRLETMRAVAFDFQKELYCPSKTSNDVYYKRQLSDHSFNVHDLGSDYVDFYCYDETIGKKGSDAVASMLSKYVMEVVPETVKEIEFFCDSCCGQNKNYTIFRFFYFLVHCRNRFDKIKVMFPERGHSYMECDRDFSIVNTKSEVELPQEWFRVIREARKSLSPYAVYEMGLCDFKDFTGFLKLRHPFPNSTFFFSALDSGPGSTLSGFEKDLAETKQSLAETKQSLSETKQILSETKQSLSETKKAKYKDLQVLKKFCSPTTHQYYEQLPHDGCTPDALHEKSGGSDTD